MPAAHCPPPAAALAGAADVAPNVAPVDVQKEPPAHTPVGAVRPVILQWRPSSHGVGAERPTVAAYVPSGQMICTVAAGGQ